MSLYEKQKQVLNDNLEKIKADMVKLEDKQKAEEEHREKMDNVADELKYMANWLHKTKDLKDYYECKDKSNHYYSGFDGFCDLLGHNRPKLVCPEKYKKGLDSLKDTHVSQYVEIRPPQSSSEFQGYGKQIKPINVPSEFMINFVESTFNMFTQLTERIKVLEDKLDSSDVTL